jgi:hypothetical protein
VVLPSESISPVHPKVLASVTMKHPGAARTFVFVCV